jgi:hypothetical protein
MLSKGLMKPSASKDYESIMTRDKYADQELYDVGEDLWKYTKFLNERLEIKVCTIIMDDSEKYWTG